MVMLSAFFAVHFIRQLTGLNQDSRFENFLEDAVMLAGKRFIYSYLMVSVKLIKHYYCRIEFCYLRCTMNLAEQVYQAIKPLPEAMVQKVLDFALFFRQREEKAEWQNLMLAQTSSLADWDNNEDEDEVWNDVPAI